MSGQVALLFLWMLATGPELPDGARVEGLHKWGSALLFSVCSAFALYAGARGLTENSGVEGDLGLSVLLESLS